MPIVTFRKKKLYIWCAVFTGACFIFTQLLTQSCSISDSGNEEPKREYHPKSLRGNNQNGYNKVESFNKERPNLQSGGSFDYNFPILFIGGVPRSGTTIMRVIADAHPGISCGEETRVVPQMLSSRRRQASEIEKARLEEAGISQQMLDEATRQYILTILTRQNSTMASKPNLQMLCDKDPFNLLGMTALRRMFPNSKFLLMIRDGRAVAHSLITRRVTIGGWNLNSYSDTLSKWSSTVKRFIEECDKQPEGSCLKVFYEQLVLQPNKTIRGIVQFLGLEWHDTMLRHQDYVGKNISVSKLERSTEQVAKPVNILGLTSWVGQIPETILHNIRTYAPMLEKLGYDLSPNPSYGEPDETVKKNQEMLNKNPEKFEIETYRWVDGKKVKGSQYGAEKMKEHQQHMWDKDQKWGGDIAVDESNLKANLDDQLMGGYREGRYGADKRESRERKLKEIKERAQRGKEEDTNPM